MLDLTAIALGPSYAVFGVPAVLTRPNGATSPIRIIDETHGATVGWNGVDNAIIQPSANVRMSDVPTRPSGTLAFSGKIWKVTSAKELVGMDGYGTGEWQMSLEEV